MNIKINFGFIGTITLVILKAFNILVNSILTDYFNMYINNIIYNIVSKI